MVHIVRGFISTTLGVPEARVRCVAPDVGGGFGVKGHPYVEEPVIAFLSRLLDRPVKWIEDRREHIISSCHSRDQTHHGGKRVSDTWGRVGRVGPLFCFCRGG